MKTVIIILLLIVVLLAAVLYESIRELRRFEVTHYHVHTKKLPKDMKEKKIAVLSDLHNCQYGPHNEELLRAIRRERPDVILIAGDMLIGKAGVPYDTALELVTQLPAIAPVYYANGNHEQRMKENPAQYDGTYEDYKKKLLKSKVHFLENETRYFFCDGIPMSIGGVEIPLRCYEKFKKAPLSKSELDGLLGKADREVYQILLAHQPVYADVYEAWGADLILSGHLHGGIVRLPRIGGVITPQFGLFPKYSGGQYDVGNASLVVSRGLGTHTINIRFCNPAELVILHLKGE